LQEEALAGPGPRPLPRAGVDLFGSSSTRANLLRPGEVLEELIGSGWHIIQSKRGYRYSLDAVLLAHFACSIPGRSALELGMGNGAVSLLLARRRAGLKIVGLELQEILASQAQRSLILNGLEKRIQVLVADWGRASHFFPPGFFDLVVANPPYRVEGTGRSSPRPEVALAKHGPQGGLQDLLKAASWVLKAKGIVALIYHASSLADLMANLREVRLEPKRLRLVHSFPGCEAEFALLSARKEARLGLQVLPPLVLFSERGGSPSSELAAIYHSFRRIGPDEGKTG
jgi:tRNA1Val (adenine37-N6)-methyltransferase